MRENKGENTVSIDSYFHSFATSCQQSGTYASARRQQEQGYDRRDEGEGSVHCSAAGRSEGGCPDAL